ncbi:C25 family cysteine peptidase [Mariniblastus sp.]|nr:C25 family cysteine peptidase [Mariniblastus sp.]
MPKVTEMNKVTVMSKTAMMSESQRMTRASTGLSTRDIHAESQCPQQEHLAPPLPANSDEQICHFDPTQPEFVGSRGLGGEGKSSRQNQSAATDTLTRHLLNTQRILTAPHPPSPSPREFGSRLMECKANSSEFKRRGGASYSFLSNLKVSLICLALFFVTVALICLPSSSAFALQNKQKADNQPKQPASLNIDTLVFCPPTFQPALNPWLDYRRQQGHRIQVLTPATTAIELKQQIAKVAADHQLAHLVLIGDAYELNADPKLLIPTEYVLSKATYKLGAEPDIATDNPFADLDGDGVPDISIGRIPVDSASELTQIIQRVIAYEAGTGPNTDPQWQTRLNLVAGVGGFGKLIDQMIEQIAKKVITEMVPDTLQTSMTYGSWNSPYCPAPERFSESAIERFNEGCLFWVYLGHGDRCRLDRVHMPDESHTILDQSKIRQVNCRSGNPIAVFLACYTNAFDGDQDCLGELMLKQPNGPIATIGGSRVTMPASMGLLSMAMLEEYFDGSATTLGEVVLKAKRELSKGEQKFDGYRELIESLSATMLPGQAFEDECADHVELMQLLGDPLLRVKRPGRINVSAPSSATAGDRINIAGDTVNIAGDAASAVNKKLGPVIVRVSYQRDRIKHRFKRRRKFASTPAESAKFQRAYDQARDLVCVEKTVAMVDGKFSTEVELPDFARGDCVITCTVVSNDGVLAGSTKIEIEKAKR